MGVIGIEEIFLQVKNMEKAIDFYHGILGIPLDKQDGEKTYLQMERGHLVLQIEDHTGFHQGGDLPLARHVQPVMIDDAFRRAAAADQDTMIAQHHKGAAIEVLQ